MSGVYFLRLDGYTGAHTAPTLIDDPHASRPSQALRTVGLIL